jgi:arylsulfatase A-like enzyme
MPSVLACQFSTRFHQGRVRYPGYAESGCWPEPPYGSVKVPEEGVKRLRANYAGEASNVDHWYGEVLQTIKGLGLHENSVIVFLADHGVLLNEQGQWAKGPERLRKRVSGFAQTPDVLPAVLGRLNIKPPKGERAAVVGCQK